MKLFASLALTLLWSSCQAYYDYQTRLPNGQDIPHPCKPNFIWHGVGHTNPRGGGSTNPFGKDFARLGHKWSRELCGLDSDGDGLTNGQELGDPRCVWTQDSLPERTDNITHPGICDPWQSPQCGAKNSWVSCDVGDFKCDAVNEPDVKNMTLRFPRTKVPTAETTYSCFIFDVPSDQPYHLIGYEAYIDNPNVMHHIVVFGCEDGTQLLDAPIECLDMGKINCNTVMAVWTLGMAGDCFHPQAGFRMGQGSTTRLAFQYHWTNKRHVDSWYDSSGLTLYFTPKLRPNDAGSFIIGQQFLEIPPGVNSLTHIGDCPGSCTSKLFQTDVNIIAVLNHMHYLGVRGNVEHLRDNRLLHNMSMDDPYSYDSPHVYRFDNPIVVRPGDQMRMICEFSSLSKPVTTQWGLGSYDEMCYGIMTYFPAPKEKPSSSCIQWKDLDFCHLDHMDCDLRTFLNSSTPSTASLIDQVMASCSSYGSCHQECPAAIAKVRQSSTCLNGRLWDFIQDNVMSRAYDTKLMKFVAAIQNCERQTVQSTTGPIEVTTPTPAKCPPAEEKQQEKALTPGASSVGEQSQLPQEPSALGTFVDLAKDLGRSSPLLQNIIFNNYNKK